MENDIIIDKKLSTEQKTAWVNALESGDFKQGEGKLFTEHENSYCCIGVWAKVNNIPIDKTGNEMIVNGITRGYVPLGEIIGNANLSHLWHMNDRKKYSFTEIAEWIKEHI